MSFISTVCDYAVKLQKLSQNPCKNVTVPKNAEAARERDFYSTEEMKHLLKLLETAPLNHRVFFHIAATGELRKGEILGLQLSDFNMETRDLYIQRTSNSVTGFGTYKDKTKTLRSTRHVKLPKSVIELVEQLAAENEEKRLQLGSKWQDTEGRLFTSWDGNPMHSNTPYKFLAKFTEQNNMRFCNCHSFRHYFCSALVDAGVPITEISAALGHASVNTTLTIYSHLFDKSGNKPAETIAKVLDLD